MYVAREDHKLAALMHPLGNRSAMFQGGLETGEGGAPDWDYILSELVVPIQRLLVESYVVELYLNRQDWINRLPPMPGYRGDYAAFARSELERGIGSLRASLGRLASLLGFTDSRDLEPLTANELRARIAAAQSTPPSGPQAPTAPPSP